jgi:hypothetical protein
MSLALFNFISVAIVVFLLIYLIVIRVAKLRFDSQPVDARLLSVLISVTQDMNFRWICNNYCQITYKQSDELFDLLNNPQRLRICADYIFRNGWVGYLPQEECYGLALPRRWPAFLLWTATCHELFHLVRHVQGIATFEQEASFPVFSLQRFWFCLSEEVVVWHKTSRVDQIGTMIVLTPFLSLPLMYMLLVLYVWQNS